MTLLFDQNISFRVSKKIQGVFSGAKHLSDLRLDNYSDIGIWEYARAHNYCIVTFDFDFIDISTLRGFPPKIILLRMGNTSTENIILRILADSKIISDFLTSKDTAFLEIK